jgi:hypothetical protein
LSPRAKHGEGEYCQRPAWFAPGVKGVLRRGSVDGGQISRKRKKRGRYRLRTRAAARIFCSHAVIPFSQLVTKYDEIAVI